MTFFLFCLHNWLPTHVCNPICQHHPIKQIFSVKPKLKILGKIYKNVFLLNAITNGDIKMILLFFIFSSFIIYEFYLNC